MRLLRTILSVLLISLCFASSGLVALPTILRTIATEAVLNMTKGVEKHLNASLLSLSEIERPKAIEFAADLTAYLEAKAPNIIEKNLKAFDAQVQKENASFVRRQFLSMKYVTQSVKDIQKSMKYFVKSYTKRQKSSKKREKEAVIQHQKRSDYPMITIRLEDSDDYLDLLRQTVAYMEQKVYLEHYDPYSRDEKRFKRQTMKDLDKKIKKGQRSLKSQAKYVFSFCYTFLKEL